MFWGPAQDLLLAMYSEAKLKRTTAVLRTELWLIQVRPSTCPVSSVAHKSTVFIKGANGKSLYANYMCNSYNLSKRISLERKYMFQYRYRQCNGPKWMFLGRQWLHEPLAQCLYKEVTMEVIYNFAKDEVNPHNTSNSPHLPTYLSTTILCTSFQFSLSWSVPISGFSSWRDTPATFTPLHTATGREIVLFWHFQQILSS